MAQTSQTALDALQPKVGYLFGQKLAKSLSPLFHGTVYKHFGLPWEQQRLDSANIAEFLELTQQPDFYGTFTTMSIYIHITHRLTLLLGAAVTMPNKVAILPYLDEMTEECRDVGACNTIFLKHNVHSGKRILCGTNTDVIGIRDSFVRNRAAGIQGKPALVVGGGGAARSAIYALRKWMGVTDIYLVNRDTKEVREMIADCTSRGYGQGLVHVATEEQAIKAETPGSIVACVPDFEPQTAQEKLARKVTEILLSTESPGTMLEMCYNPTPYTKLGSIAEDNGWRVILGTEAMIWQGVEQDKYWTGRSAEEMPIEKLQEVIAQAIQKPDSSRL